MYANLQKNVFWSFFFLYLPISSSKNIHQTILFFSRTRLRCIWFQTLRVTRPLSQHVHKPAPLKRTNTSLLPYRPSGVGTASVGLVHHTNRSRQLNADPVSCGTGYSSCDTIKLVTMAVSTPEAIWMNSHNAQVFLWLCLPKDEDTFKTLRQFFFE